LCCGFAKVQGALESFTRSAAAEHAPAIRVNCIAPSLTDTPLASKILASDTTKLALGKAHPLARVGNVSDQVEAALFLLDPAKSSWVTGQVLHVDGGRSTIQK
jgi:NAD(P)-dependent dehydrogenase (short-subunit alcohol dehydrogenase family)